MKRAVLIVIDSVGIGSMPDAEEFGDRLTYNTIGNTARQAHMKLSNMARLGLGNIIELDGIPKTDTPAAYYGKSAELSKAKDTISGHWEITGIVSPIPFQTYHDGFPPAMLQEFVKETGYEYLGNKTASGTEIIKELGAQHIKTKKPIVYTSFDSVFQIAAHEEVFGLQELYRVCKISRKICDKYGIARVIARPFVGAQGNFTRTYNRTDYAVTPPHEGLLNNLQKANVPTIAVGKIYDIFCGSGISEKIKTGTNKSGMEEMITDLKKYKEGLIFINLVDFDMLAGHRRDATLYKNLLEDFDRFIPQLEDKLRKDDLLIITADHGCDPTAQGTDRTREYVPLLVYSKSFTNCKSLGIRESFADVGQTLAQYFNCEKLKIGKSFLDELE